MPPIELNKVTDIIIGVAIEIHRKLGPGLLESVYKIVLAHELRKRGLKVETEVSIPLLWDGIQMDAGFRADIIVEGQIILELKSVERTAPVHAKQLMTYLRLANKPLGLLLNFGLPMLKDGIERIAND